MIELRREKADRIKYSDPTVSLLVKDGSFTVYKSALDYMCIDVKTDALMFYISESNKRVVIKKEPACSDNYRLNKKAGNAYAKFYSKSLLRIIMSTLSIVDKRAVFDVSKIEDNKFLLTLREQ